MKQQSLPMTYNLALVQMAMDTDVQSNIDRALAWCEKAAAQGGHVICLPELFASRYFCQKECVERFQLAQSVDDPMFARFAAFCKAHGVVVVVPFFERRAAGLYHNSVIVFDGDGSRCGLYRKMHIPDDPAYYEKFYFTPGDLGFLAFDTCFGSIGPLICWDQWYPEAARITALQGANTLLYPTAIGWHPYEKEEYGKTQYESWQNVQRGHAIANGVYVGAANRVGHEAEEGQSGIQFWGGSFICDPQGNILAQASDHEEEVILATVDLALLESIRQNWPFLRDRRIDAYAAITQRYLDQGK
ncbi:MAG: carbon-nitrogen hydrolase [Candidatus Hydrogenedentes bacterium]|nr:carbon-nitrogen hydrolase [Candidatus Hydrogenedentota bacterium]